MLKTLEFGFRAAMNECKCSSYWKFVMKVLNCVLLNIDSVLIEWLFDEVWSQAVMLLGIWGIKTLQTFTFSIQLPLAGKVWQCVTSLNVDQRPDHIQEQLLTWLCCTPWNLTWHDTTCQIIIEALIWSWFCTWAKWAGFMLNLNLIYPQLLCIAWGQRIY